ncbi:helix-turn-helix transcriptional regulator [Acidocella sp. MX-AZ03]|uniref:helix-turn-helix transcriptional regulator n=1 Tax=Acidocella sp. MX-AZ03 TaxID=2697363 RepID=UPI003FA43B33
MRCCFPPNCWRRRCLGRLRRGCRAARGAAPAIGGWGARDFVGQVLGLIRDGFLNGAAQIDQVAQRLGVSRAGLHRRLRQEGVAFSDLTARIRRDLAQDYVGQPGIAFTDIALLLGYSELSAFTRAFTRWTGRSPRGTDRRADTLPDPRQRLRQPQSHACRGRGEFLGGGLLRG